MTSKQRTVCDPNCHANPKCGLSATVENGKITAVDPADYPVPGYENRICALGRSRLEYQYHPERLRSPLKRVGARGEGRWEEISWDEAVALFVDAQKRISEKYGSRAVAFNQISGAFGILTRGAALRYAALTEATAIRASGVDYGVAKGLEYMFGVPATSFFGPGGPALSDTENSKLTIIWGNNHAVTRSVDHVALKRACRSGTKLICVDPVKSETAGFCDEWVSLRPGSDGALALAMVREIIDQKLFVEPQGEAKSDFDIFRAFANAYGIGDYFEKTPEEYLDTVLATDSPLLQGVNVERLKAEKAIYPWPSDEPYVGFKDREFPTASGRVEIYKEDLAEYAAELPFYKEPIEASPKNPLFEKYPLVLLSSHSRYRIHSTFANLETVKRREPEPIVRVHPADARSRGIRDGAVIDLFNDRGRVKLRCKVDDAMREGCILIGEGHWIDQFIEGDPYGLTHDQYSPTTENYAHYDVLVEMTGV